MGWGWRITVASALGCSGCGPDDIGLGHTGFGTVASDPATGTSTGTSSAASADETIGDDATPGSSDDGATTSPGFPDVGTIPDPPVDGIPETCAEAEQLDSTVGCLFFAADLDDHPTNQAEPWGISVGNVQTVESGLFAHVVAEVLIGGAWRSFEEVDVPPAGLHLFLPGQFPHEPTARIAGATVRITADVPITAHQFNPIAKSRATSDASMIYPVSAWDDDYVMIGRPHIGADAGGELYPYFTIVASENDTVVTIVPSVATRAGAGVPAGQAGEPFEITLQAGELAQVTTESVLEGADLTGSQITTAEATPIAVFGAHRCAYVPFDAIACDHLEEQLSGRHQWGRRYAAVRATPRLADVPEPTLWQLVAAADTVVTFIAHDDVTGLPAAPIELAAGQSYELMVGGTAAHPGDFTIDATEPVAVMQYLVGGSLAGSGDPSAIQLAPIDQFIERLVVLVPDKWAADHVAITRVAGAQVWLDDAPVADDEFVAVDPSGTHEAARLELDDGAHTIVSTQPLSAIVVGYDAWDSYGYLGGARTVSIYEPEG